VSGLISCRRTHSPIGRFANSWQNRAIPRPLIELKVNPGPAGPAAPSESDARYPLFADLGARYPVFLAQRYGRILTRMVKIWDSAEIHDYFSDLLIDKRGGRKGFPQEALDEIVMLREFKELETFRHAEKKEDAIRTLSQRGIHLKTENFYRALDDGNPELVDLFLRAKFDIHVTDEQGTPPLLYALKKGHTVVAKILLDAGAEVNARDQLGLTPLLVACGKATQGYRSIAEGLILKGAIVNVRDSLGYTPLLLALTGGNLDIAKLLIQRGANVTATTRQGESALVLARGFDTPQGAEIVALLTQKGA